MNKMKVLWFSNCILGNKISDGSGSWLYAMSRLIKDSIELTNVTKASVKEVTFNTYESFREITFPAFNPQDTKIINGIVTNRIQLIIETVKPDIIHIWGTEGCWATLFEKGIIQGKIILEIQGLMAPIVDSFWGGLNPFDVKRQSLCVRNIVYPSQSIHNSVISYQKGAKNEERILKKVQNVSTQSNWVRDHIQFYLSDNCRVFNTLRPIRQEFWEAEPWVENNHDSLRIFSSMSYYDPFKGMHILIKAVAVLKKKYHNIKLEIAGVRKADLVWYRQFDCIKYLKKLAKDLGVWENIEFVDRCSADQLIEHLRACDVFVNPSFVESFSASTAEALVMGVPTVVAYAGAMPDFSEELPVTLFYSPLDYTACAAQILRLKENKKVRNSLRSNARRVMPTKCGNEYVKQVQLSIYKSMMIPEC